MAALWDVATLEERYEMVTILLEPEGFSYDPEWNMIAALKPRPAFLPIFRLLQGVFEHKETSELLVTIHWSQRNRRAMNHRSPLALIPIEKVFVDRNDILMYKSKSSADERSIPRYVCGRVSTCWTCSILSLILLRNCFTFF
ncbi:hypothetical protein KSC_057940 [Ktedonobacter sp. SOSP1-52]|nr:hypothetical protein KSC_057940 [Ktedonobacter sp. SOSP1-52]